MLRFKNDDFDVEIKFDHRVCDPDFIERHSGINVDGDRRCSMATVTINGSSVGEGISICNPKDNFCKTIGRKKALAYALCPVGRSLRQEIWNEYEAMCGF